MIFAKIAILINSGTIKDIDKILKLISPCDNQLTSMFLSFFCISYRSQIICKSQFLQKSRFGNNSQTIRDIEKISNLTIAQLIDDVFVFLHFDPISNRLTLTSKKPISDHCASGENWHILQ